MVMLNSTSFLGSSCGHRYVNVGRIKTTFTLEKLNDGRNERLDWSR